MDKIARLLFWMALGGAIIGWGCASKGKSEVAVRQAIEDHLAGTPGLANSEMVMELKQVEVQGDKAEAEVIFRSRNNPQARMAFHYQLRSEGNKWKVESGHPSRDTTPHPSSGSADSLPEGHPPLGEPPER